MLVGDTRGFTPCRTIELVQWLSAPFGSSLSIIYRLEHQFKRDYDRKNLLVTDMSIETLEQKIAKQEERLKQLKAQKSKLY